MRLVETMKKGSTMQVQGTSERGTASIDTYSLNGLPQAMQALTELCQCRHQRGSSPLFNSFSPKDAPIRCFAAVSLSPL
jgi:hypothetical protein